MNEQLRRSSAHVFVVDIGNPVVSENDHHHLGRVLRLRRGEVITCSDGRGSWRTCEWNDGITSLGDVYVEKESLRHISVAVAPLKGDRTELVVEKLVEIGVDRIVVLAPTDHSVVRWGTDKVNHVMERYEKIARAAAMQSRRVFLPLVVGPLALSELVQQHGPSNVMALAEPGGTCSLEDVDSLVIGPEGGWSETELSLAPTLVDLGGSILRAETAAIVGASRMVAHKVR